MNLTRTLDAIEWSSIEDMSTPRERLQKHMTVFQNMPGNEGAARPTIAAANVECAIEITEALVGLTVAVNDMANRSVTVMNNVIEAIDKSTKQLVISSNESTSVARESANLSAKLNGLTKWMGIA